MRSAGISPGSVGLVAGVLVGAAGPALVSAPQPPRSQLQWGSGDLMGRRKRGRVRVEERAVEGATGARRGCARKARTEPRERTQSTTQRAEERGKPEQWGHNAQQCSTVGVDEEEGGCSLLGFYRFRACWHREPTAIASAKDRSAARMKSTTNTCPSPLQPSACMMHAKILSEACESEHGRFSRHETCSPAPCCACGQLLREGHWGRHLD